MKSAPSSLTRRLRDSAFVIVVCAILLAAGTATAAKLITGKDIANHSITGKDIKKKSLPLSVLKTTPVGTPGPKGDKGSPGAAGSIGPEGDVGPAAITEVIPLEGPIQATIESGPGLHFVGQPATIVVTGGDLGQVTGTVSIGTTGEGPIDDAEKFGLTICVGEEGKVFALNEEEEETEEFGVSPFIETRTAVTVSSGFFVFTEEEGFFEAEIGPCVFNETGKDLNDNDRLYGTVIVASS